MKKILSSLLITALVVPSIFVPASVFAAEGSVIVDTINGNPPGSVCITGAITVVGHGVTGSNGGPYNLDVEWGDGFITHISLPSGGSDPFTFTATHTPTQVTTTFGVFLYHSQRSGGDAHVDITTFCAAPPTTAVLNVIKHVINNNGGTATSPSFSLHVKNNSNVDVPNGGNGISSPTPGSEAAKSFIITPNGAVYTVSEDIFPGYTQTSATGSCAVVLVAGQNYTCTITNDDNANTSPTAQAKSIVTNEDVATSSAVKATDSDVPAQTLTYGVALNPTHGTITGFNVSTGAFTYTPFANYNGSDSFTFTGYDGTASSSPATVSITVNPVNDNPVISMSTTTTITINELINITFTASATDVDGDTPAFSLTGNPAGSSINSTTGVFTWTPTEAQGPGTYTFFVTVSDGNGGTDSKSFTVNVIEVNVPPITTDNTTSTHQATAVVVNLASLTTDVDLPLQSLTFSVTIPAHGTAVVSGSQVTYTPSVGFTGTDTFTYKANDGVVNSNVSTITVNVSDGAPALTLIPDATINELLPFSFIVTASDPDSDPLTYLLTSLVTGWNFDTTSHVFTWTPTEAQGPGSYNFLASVNDGAQTTSQSFTVNVSEVNVAPVSNDQSITTNEDTAKTGTLTGSDSDIPAQVLTFATTTNPAHGTLALTSNGAFTYTPDTNYNGSDSFKFVANDGVTNSVPSTVSITVSPVNDAPTVTLNGGNVTLVKGSTYTEQGAVCHDVEDLALTPTITGAVITSTVGTYTLTYTCTDSGEQSVSVQRTVTVQEAPAMCSDGIDNDGDHLIDQADPGCHSDGNPNNQESYTSTKNDETDPVVDMCSNIEGTQATVPAGMTVSNGICTTIPTPPAPPSGGGGGGGNGPISGSLGGGGQVLGASIVKGEVLGESCGVYMNKHVRLGSKKNDSAQVKKLQNFLNKYMNANLLVSGFYGTRTETAVKNFQKKYSRDILVPWALTKPTGLIYLSTLYKVNMIECPDLTIKLPPLIPWSQNPNAQ